MEIRGGRWGGVCFSVYMRVDLVLVKKSLELQFGSQVYENDINTVRCDCIRIFF